jgi:hypothetical protein
VIQSLDWLRDAAMFSMLGFAAGMAARPYVEGTRRLPVPRLRRGRR